MFLSLKRCFTPSVLALTVFQTFSPCFAADLPIRLSRIFPKKVDDVGKKPKTWKDGCVEELAKNIDWLEHHINMNGTVVAKTPDVWGEARLTAHRQEFEDVLKDELRAFQKNAIQGADFVSDQAFLAFAMSLQAGPSSAKVPALPTFPGGSVTATATDGTKTTTTNVSGPVNSIFGATPFGSGGFGTNPFGANPQLQLEQTEVLDQLANYVNHLHALRRNNEGPDTADAPGYAMNLIRIPVSILPGQNTKRGYGAEITVTAEPYLGPELLPTAFRDFVTNDLVDQLSLPLAQYLNSDRAKVRDAIKTIKEINTVVNEFDKHYDSKANNFREELSSAIKMPQIAGPIGGLSQRFGITEEVLVNEAKEYSQGRSNQKTTTPIKTPRFAESYKAVCDPVVRVNIGSSATRRSTFPFPPSQLTENFGGEELSQIIVHVWDAFKDDLINNEVVHISDLQGFLREEIASAYELLANPKMLSLWYLEVEADVKLSELIRTRNIKAIEERHHSFNERLMENGDVSEDGQISVTGHLAWCLYVDSLLLNERLVRDIQRTFGNTPNTPCSTSWQQYYLPDPPQEARQAFAEYVKVRWPIHVFALDPVVNEQNIADVRSIYRQMQLALAVSYAAGEVGTNSALQAMRKLQRDRATIDLNRTAIAFGHGEDTFGWRFKARFQTPPVQGNATVFFRDLIVGGPTDRQLEASEILEPGIRECSAIVIMPSFVPHVTLHTRGNWYKVNCPTRSGDSVHDTVHYSRAIKQMELNAHTCCQCAHLYRDGEVERLLRRVKQLDRKLALQTMECQVPIENTLGGHEILSGGKRELAPELTGWYGSPGYDQSKGTTLFLSGDSFSVTKSRLIVGNQPIECKLLSRQIMQVDLPPGLSILRDRKLDDIPSERYFGYVDAQVATPYGVSGHMLIPVVRPVSVATQVLAVRPNTIHINAVLVPGAAPAVATDRTLFTVSKYGPVLNTVNLLQIDVPKGDGLQEQAAIQAVLFATKDSDRLIDISPITLSTADGGASFASGSGELATQFSSSSDAGKLGGVIAGHISYLLSTGQAPVGKTIKYQLGVGVSSFAAADVKSHPLTKALGGIQIEVTLVEPK